VATAQSLPQSLPSHSSGYPPTTDPVEADDTALAHTLHNTQAEDNYHNKGQMADMRAVLVDTLDTVEVGVELRGYYVVFHPGNRRIDLIG
jgi:hypothetical protein